MAKLVGIYQEESCALSRRQLPMEVDETLTMILELNIAVPPAERVAIMKNKELGRFVDKFFVLSNKDIGEALTVPAKDLFTSLSHRLPCVGCRRSVERLFNQLTENGNLAMDPLVVTENALLTVDKDCGLDVMKLYELFYIFGNHLNGVIEAIPKNKKNRRCVLHSLESQRTKPFGSWSVIWEVMSQECQDEVVLVEADTLMDTLETYLRKHKFCSECKVKVVRAYDLLFGNLDASKEKGFVAQLYEGVRCCHSEQHVHINRDTDFITRLIARAEPEFRGKSTIRERHAKTVENAQEEVLTCLGICLYERLYRIWQRLNEEHQIWQILFCLGVHELRKNFELAVEAKQGFTQMERVCEEFMREDEEKETRLRNKRIKRRRKRNRVLQSRSEEIKENASLENCECDIEPVAEDATCDGYKEETCNDVACTCAERTSTARSSPTDNPSDACVCCKCDWNTSKGRQHFYNESGYCSVNSNDSSSSCENSEIACNDACCSHEKESFQLTANCDKVNASGHTDAAVAKPEPKYQLNCCNRSRCVLVDYGSGTSLQDMLEEWSPSEDEPMSPEEVLELKAKLCQLNPQRLELRRKLRQRFASLRHKARFRYQPLVPTVNKRASNSNKC